MVSASIFYLIYCISIVQNNIIRGALVLCAAIRQSLFCQNVLRDLPKFNNIKVSRYTVFYSYKLTMLALLFILTPHMEAVGTT